MATSWEGKRCLITGGTKGIGRATVEAFAAEKAQVFTCARNEEELNKALEEWKSKDYNVQGCVCDVSEPDSLKALISECFGGRLNVLVNNAGMNIRKQAVNYTDDDYDKVMGTNLRPCYDLSRMCHPMLKDAQPSSVVFLGSVAASRALSSGCIYGMTKASLSHLAKNLACEWALDGIRVNCLAPGYIDTPMIQQLKKQDGFLDQLMRETPMKRLGEAEEIASTPETADVGASFITGQTLYVDGGFSIRGFGY